MSRLIVAEVGRDLTPEAVALAGFRAGWEAACLAVADGLEEAKAPPSVVAAVRASAAMPPTPRVEASCEVGHG